jgi:hypothetical protein
MRADPHAAPAPPVEVAGPAGWCPSDAQLHTVARFLLRLAARQVERQAAASPPTEGQADA